jgi:hypothetical protein
MNINIKEKLDSKTNMSYSSFVKMASEIEKGRTDYLVDDIVNNLRLEDCNFRFIPNGKKNNKTMPATDLATNQLSVKLGVPANYVNKCRASGLLSLGDDNINQWMERIRENGGRKANMLIRTYNGTVDAALSDRYAIFDSPEILDVINDIVNPDDYRVVGSYISDERMHLRMVSHNPLSVPGEDLFPGIFIDSSDVGRTACSVSFFIFKQVCTNGLCVKKLGGELYHQRHIGIRKSEMVSEMKRNLKILPAVIANAESAILNAAATKVDLTDETVFQAWIADLKKQAQVSEEVAANILNMAKEKYSLNVWGIVNGLTEVAQQFELDDRVRLETVAGDILVKH